MNKLVSVALCTYNGVLFIEKQILSILNQSYKPFELVVVDDCSTDGTYSLLKDMATKYPEIKVFRNEKNLGFNKNFERAIGLCSGDYIALSDQDDIWLPKKLELLYAHIKDCWLVFSNSEFIDSEENALDQFLLAPSFEMKERSFKSALFYNSITGHSLMFVKEFKDYFMPIPDQGYYDWWMGFIALYHHKATYVNEVLTLHRIHADSVTNKTWHKTKREEEKARRMEVEMNLINVKTYKNLSSEDSNLIARLYKAYMQKDRFFFMRLFIKNYPLYFPDLKARSFWSRLNFGFKFK